MLELLGQRDLIERRVEQRTSYTTGLEVMAWKDCASGRPRREAYPVEGLRGTIPNGLFLKKETTSEAGRRERAVGSLFDPSMI